MTTPASQPVTDEQKLNEAAEGYARGVICGGNEPVGPYEKGVTKFLHQAFLDGWHAARLAAGAEPPSRLLELSDKWRADAERVTPQNDYDRGWIDSRQQCATDATLRALAAAPPPPEAQRDEDTP